jgi:hypothetical protein
MIMITQGFPDKGMTYEALPHLFSAPVGTVKIARLLTLFSAQVLPRCFDCGGRYPRALAARQEIHAQAVLDDVLVKRFMCRQFCARCWPRNSCAGSSGRGAGQGIHAQAVLDEVLAKEFMRRQFWTRCWPRNRKRESPFPRQLPDIAGGADRARTGDLRRDRPVYTQYLIDSAVFYSL